MFKFFIHLGSCFNLGDARAVALNSVIAISELLSAAAGITANVNIEGNAYLNNQQLLPATLNELHLQLQ